MTLSPAHQELLWEMERHQARLYELAEVMRAEGHPRKADNIARWANCDDVRCTFLAKSQVIM